MTTATLPLQDLAIFISEREAELTQLREEYEARNAKLSELNRRKEELQQQLQQVELESEIQQVGQKSASTSPVSAPVPVNAPVAIKATPSPSAAPAPAPASSNGDAMSLSLPKFLVHLVEQADHPLTAKELAQEVVRCGYPSKSKDLPGMVETRVSELVRKGILERTPDKTALVLPGKPVAKTSTPAPSSKTTESRSTSAAPSQSTTSTQSSTTGRAPSLKQLLYDVLSESTEPMKTSELAQAVLNRGYTTTSKDFKNVIWVCIGDMENVENIRGQGYRLKRGKVAK